MNYKIFLKKPVLSSAQKAVNERNMHNKVNRIKLRRNVEVTVVFDGWKTRRGFVLRPTKNGGANVWSRAGCCW